MFSQGKSQGAATPTALGTLSNSSCYGSVIPQGYGLTQSPLLAIWAANLRQGLSGKKLKNFWAAKKGELAYCENIDFLIGHNPIQWVGDIWNNGANPNAMEVRTASFAAGPFGSPSFHIVDIGFYAVIGVTMELDYSVVFNDYGGNGSVSASGTFNLPLWNEYEAGPDPTNMNQYRKWPYTYRWQPSDGQTVSIDGRPMGQGPEFTTITVYYLGMTNGNSVSANRLEFENELGNGSEFADYESNRIVYPMFAGLGSTNFDLGTIGAIPSLKAAVKFPFGYWPTGDADFADMIEDIVKSGVAQAALGTSTTDTTFTGLSHGLQGYNYPGPIQKQRYEIFEGTFNFVYDLPNTAGNILVAVMYTCGAGITPPPAGFSDSNGNTWTVAASATTTGSSVPGTWTIGYALNCNAGKNSVTITGQAFYHTTVMIFELQGVDSFDGVEVAVGSNPTASITTTNAKNFPGYVMAFSSQNNSGSYSAGIPNEQRWPVLLDEESFTGQFVYYGQYRITNQGQTLSQNWYTNLANSTDSFICLIAFKATVPSSISSPLVDFMDEDSLNLVRTQCMAYGLYGSMTMTSQQSASDWLKKLYQAANAAPCYYGWRLYSFPYAEQSAVGNGAVYTSPTASGPVAYLSDLNGDFITNGGKNCVEVTTVDRSDKDNVLQMQCFSREANYNQVTISQPIAAGISIFSTKKADPVTMPMIQDTSIGRSILGISVRTNVLGGDSYTFTVPVKYDWLGLMDLVNITDTKALIFGQDVRIISMQEQEDGSHLCTAEPFIYGMKSPTALIALAPTPSQPNNPQAPAGNVNAPVIFEPPVRITASGLAELWLGISNDSANYGGSQVLVSSDGGASYQTLGQVSGNATQGVSTADWPAHADPDTSNDLSLDLTESDGVLDDYTATERDTFSFLAYIAGGGSSNIPYELLAYDTANLTGTNLYTVKATAGGTNEIRRGVYNCPLLAAGVDHPTSSAFLFLNPTGAGILKVLLPLTWIGVPLKFKILSFNNQGGGLQDASTVSVYSYTPLGLFASATLANGTYTQSPNDALTQPTSTSIAMAAVTTTFSSNSVKYNARTFTITAPSVPTWYYLTIADPSYVGDTGSATTLTATLSTSTTLVGVPGNTYIGAILALPGGSATVITPGGYPPQQVFTVNGS